jgi:hypothetical protein
MRQLLEIRPLGKAISAGSLLCALVLACFAIPNCSVADVLISVNGERFVGKITEETTNSVVFESETAGRLTIPRDRIRELQRAPAALTSTNQVSTNVLPALVVSTNAAATNIAWLPPSVGKDKFDWLKLKSDEWLKGHLNYVQDKKVSFESDKLEDLTLKLKDVRFLFPAEPMFTKFEGSHEVYGTVTISNDLVRVIGPEQVEFARDLLTGITPGGDREINFWCLRATVGANFQSGNTKQTTVNTSAELARRTPATQLILNYLANFSEVNGEQNANNHRFGLTYDVRLNRNWFVRPVQLEYYRDQLANIAHRATAGVGVGYYIFDSDDLEWKVVAGPGYQYTRFETVESGQSDSASTPAAIFQTKFKADITSRITFYQTIDATLASEAAGLYSHHFISTLEFEIKHALNLDLSFVWDYLQNPQAEADGVVPKHSDLRVTLGVGVKF